MRPQQTRDSLRLMRRHSGEHAFTLIELLTVMVVAAILFGIAFPAYISVMERARKTEAQNSEQQIVTAVNSYYTEYGKYPLVTADTVITGTSTPSSADLFYTLRAIASGANAGDVANPRKIVFIQPRTSKLSNPAKSGIGSTGAELGVWFDPWGSPYNVAIDGNYNNQVANPYGGAGGAGSDPINQGVIVWAFGKNGVLGGGAPVACFTAESGTAGNFSGSCDVTSWQ